MKKEPEKKAWELKDEELEKVNGGGYITYIDYCERAFANNCSPDCSFYETCRNPNKKQLS